MQHALRLFGRLVGLKCSSQSVAASPQLCWILDWVLHTLKFITLSVIVPIFKRRIASHRTRIQKTPTADTAALDCNVAIISAMRGFICTHYEYSSSSSSLCFASFCSTASISTLVLVDPVLWQPFGVSSPHHANRSHSSIIPPTAGQQLLARWLSLVASNGLGNESYTHPAISFQSVACQNL